MTALEWTEFLNTLVAHLAAIDLQTRGVLVTLGIVAIASILRRTMNARFTRRLSSALDSYANREIERLVRRDPRKSGVNPHIGARRPKLQLATDT
jgi:hypothetical protein